MQMKHPANMDGRKSFQRLSPIGRKQYKDSNELEKQLSSMHQMQINRYFVVWRYR